MNGSKFTLCTLQAGSSAPQKFKNNMAGLSCSSQMHQCVPAGQATGCTLVFKKFVVVTLQLVCKAVTMQLECKIHVTLWQVLMSMHVHCIPDICYQGRQI